MEFFSGAAAFMLYCCVTLRRRGTAASAERVATRVCGRSAVTDLIACGWVAVCVFCLLLLLKPPVEATAGQTLAVVIPLITACAAIERWRWARKALVGIGMVAMSDVLVAALRIGAAEYGSWSSGLVRLDVWARVLSGFTGQPGFGTVVFALAGATIAWMSREQVRREFEHRKRAKTSAYQIGIAAVLVVVYSLGLSVSGVSRSVHEELRAARERSRMSAGRELAANRGSTSGRASRQ